MPQLVSRDAVERLRTESLDLPEWVGAPRSSTFGELVSWATWAPEVDGVSPLTTAADLSVLAPDRLDGVARADIVLVGTGSHVRPTPPADWAYGHTGRRDFLMGRLLHADALAREHLEGAYLTAVFKGRAVNSEMDLTTELRLMDAGDRERLVGEMGRMLERELAIIGATDPVLVAAGDHAARWLAELFGDRYRIVKFPTWSTSLDNERFLAEAGRGVRRVARAVASVR